MQAIGSRCPGGAQAAPRQRPPQPPPFGCLWVPSGRSGHPHAVSVGRGGAVDHTFTETKRNGTEPPRSVSESEMEQKASSVWPRPPWQCRAKGRALGVARGGAWRGVPRVPLACAPRPGHASLGGCAGCALSVPSPCRLGPALAPLEKAMTRREHTSPTTARTTNMHARSTCGCIACLMEWRRWRWRCSAGRAPLLHNYSREAAPCAFGEPPRAAPSRPAPSAACVDRTRPDQARRTQRGRQVVNNHWTENIGDS